MHTPQRALEDGVSGQVTFDCLVANDGGLTDCAPTSESPAGYGFARSARGLLSYYRMAAYDQQGNPTANRRHRLTLNIGRSVD